MSFGTGKTQVFFNVLYFVAFFDDSLLNGAKMAYWPASDIVQDAFWAHLDLSCKHLGLSWAPLGCPMRTLAYA